MSKRKLQNQRRNRNAQYYAEELVNILEISEKRRRRENTISYDQIDIDEWENNRNGHHTKYTDDKTRNSADDNSVVITYRKMSDKADDNNMNTETKDTETDDDLDEEIYLRTLTLRIPNSRSLRSRKNRTGLLLEEEERDEIEYIIDEMNPTKLQREDNEESEDFQDSVSDMSTVIPDNAGTTTLTSDTSKNINTYPMKMESKLKGMDRKYSGAVYFYYVAASVFIGIALLYFSMNML